MFNALDNDGSVAGWEDRHGLTMAPPPPFPLPDGSVFDLEAYRRSRADLTSEFAALMPQMIAFTAAWLREHGDARAVTAVRTAKSYFLQEAEGLSRWAKMRWAELRGGGHVTNLQHDGIVLDLPDGADVAEVLVQLAEACEAVLGYPQPVEDKPLGADVDDSDDEGSDEDGDGR